MGETVEGIDEQVIPVWRWHGAILSLVLSALGTLGVTTAVASGGTAILYTIAAALALFLVFARIIWYPRAAYSRWRFSISPRDVKIWSGVVFHKEVHIPMDRVQHVDLERGPIERTYGLARLTLFTAGTRDAKQVIPGLNHERAMVLRDQIARRLNETRREA